MLTGTKHLNIFVGNQKKIKSISRRIIHSYYHFSKSTVVILQHLCILLQKNPTYYM